MSGLNEYLVEKREALRAQKLQTQEAGYPPHIYGAHVTSDDRTGVRKVNIRGHHLLSDSGASSGGFDLGPTPVELLFAAIGTCLVSTFLSQAAPRGIPVDAVDVDVQGQTDPRGSLPNYPDVPNYPHNLSFELRVKSRAPTEKIEELFEAAEQHCTVSRLVAKTQELHGRLVHESPAAEVASVAS